MAVDRSEVIKTERGKNIIFINKASRGVFDFIYKTVERPADESHFQKNVTYRKFQSVITLAVTKAHE